MKVDFMASIYLKIFGFCQLAIITFLAIVLLDFALSLVVVLHL